MARFSIPSPSPSRPSARPPRAAGAGAAAAAALSRAPPPIPDASRPPLPSSGSGSRTPGSVGFSVSRPAPPSLAAVKAALGFEPEEAKARELDELASRYGPRAPRTAAGGGGSGGGSSSSASGGGGGGGLGATAAAAPSGDSGDPTLAQLLAEAATLVTEQDAVAFFLRHGADCPIKYMYLVNAVPPDSKGARFAPYSLLVTTEVLARKRGDYYVMSARGVMFNRPGHPAEFTPLAEFMRESSAFTVISSQSFFKMYLYRKMFASWGASVRFNRYLRARTSARDKLFSWSPTFSPALAEITGQLTLMGGVQCLVLLPGSRFSAASLQETQAAVRADAAKRWEKLISGVLSSVERVVLAVGQRVLSIAAPNRGGGRRTTSTRAWRCCGKRRRSGRRSCVPQRRMKHCSARFCAALTTW